MQIKNAAVLRRAYAVAPCRTCGRAAPVPDVLRRCACSVAIAAPGDIVRHSDIILSRAEVLAR